MQQNKQEKYSWLLIMYWRSVMKSKLDLKRKDTIQIKSNHFAQQPENYALCYDYYERG